jgi:hypothetical protein
VLGTAFYLSVFIPFGSVLFCVGDHWPDGVFQCGVAGPTGSFSVGPLAPATEGSLQNGVWGGAKGIPGSPAAAKRGQAV